jgi:tryptophanyl-tRNA synthetase
MMKAATQQIMLSGIKPTANRVHIGNYFGALQQFAELQYQYRTYIFIADYHALTTHHDAASLRENSLSVALDYLAVGLDPHHVVLFRQSDVPAHTECAWIFNCITSMGYLQRGHAYKDAQQRESDVTVGTFDYPMLMAADILLYDADVVPVGEDQKQHLEFARDTAERFNHLFGETFQLPRAHILESAGTVPGIDGNKMSKSHDNTIPLFASDDEIDRLVSQIVTDSSGVEQPKDPEASTLIALHRLFSSSETVAELEERYRSGGVGYKEVKERLADNIKSFMAPLRERRAQLADNLSAVEETLQAGAEIARETTEHKMRSVRDAVGVR